jgi:RHS repeat-associated protein
LADSTKADTLKYDEAGNLRIVRTRRGDAVTMTYDLVGRLRSRSGPDFPVDSMKYDPAGRWVVAWNANQRDSLALDQAGRPASTKQQMLGGVTYTLSYTFDIRNRLTNRTAPTGGNVTKHVFNSTSGALDTLCAAAACAAFKRNGERLRDTTIYNPGLSGNWRRLTFYDSTHAVKRDSFNLVGLDTLFGGRWIYDSAGRMQWEDSSAAGTRKRRSYTFDVLGRLVNACDAEEGFTQQGYFFWCENEYGNLDSAYAYDAAGNRIDPSASATVGAGNRVSAFRGFTLGYDANGNITTKTGSGASYTYTWDALNRLVEVRNGGILIASFKYDALGRRVAGTAADGTTERYVHDGDRVIMDVTGAHVVKTEYGYQSDGHRLFAIKQVQTPFWIGIVLTDPLIGSVRGIANLSGGALRKKYQLTAWGQSNADTGVVTRFRMAGREYDQATKLYYMRARYYDPEIGRFISEDPFGIGGGLNLYSYANNEPVSSWDPTGLKPCEPADQSSPLTSATSDPDLPEYDCDGIEVIGDNGDPPPLPACAYFGTCGAFPPGEYQPPPGNYAPNGPAVLNAGPTTSCWSAVGDLALNAILDLTGFALLKKGLRLFREARKLSLGAAYFANKGRWILDGQSYHNVVVNSVIPELRHTGALGAAVMMAGRGLTLASLREGGDPLDQALDIVSLAPLPGVGTATSAVKLALCLTR